MGNLAAVRDARAGAFLSQQDWPGVESAPQLARILTIQAHRAAEQVRPAGLEFEDLLTEGFLCARQARASFDPGRGVPFPAYYQLLLRRRFIDLARRKHPRTNADLESALTPRTDRAERTEQLQREVRDALARLLHDDVLSAKKREVFRLFHLEGWELTQLSRNFGKCVETIRRWLKQAEERFKWLWLQGESG